MSQQTGTFFRTTLLGGLASAYALAQTLGLQPVQQEDVVHTLNDRAAQGIRIWGESTIPYLLCITLRLEQRDALRAENLLLVALQYIVTVNGGHDGRGVADPYHGPEECVRFALGFEDENTERFHGQSYTAATLIDYLARRLRRQSLAAIWHQITEIALAQAQPPDEGEWFRWQTEKVELTERLPARPQSWAILLDAALQRDTAAVPKLLKQHPWFLPYFMLVYPHRLQPNLLKTLEDALNALDA
jgi:hypothetical protein